MSLADRARRWADEQASPAARRARLERAAPVLEASARRVVGQPGGRRAPSAPGQPPRRRTGALQRSLRAVVTGDGLSLRGNAAAGYLEHGTARMAARPFADESFRQCDRQLRQILLEGR